MATKSALTADEQQKIVSGFQSLRDEQSQLIEKIQNLEADLIEHDIVIKTLFPITDKQRRCYRMIGGILIEHTIDEVLPALEINREQIHNVILNLKQKNEDKTKELITYKQNYNIHFSSEQSNDQEKEISKKSLQESGVLINKEN